MIADPSGPILTVRNVSNAYGPRQVLCGVDLSLRRGEVYALLGPNGAGKTTLMRVICGRLKPDSGEVRVAGGDPYRDPAARRALGLAPQALALYGHMTVRENLEVFGALAGLKGDALKAAVAEAMAVTQTAERADTPVARLSGGYQRRVNIAAAIIHHPALLILDEPTVGVDMAARAAVDTVIRALADSGAAVLLVTHDLDQAGGLADRVGFLRAGRLVLEGEPAALVREAFGERQEVVVEVAGDLGPALQAALAAEGLARAADGDGWSCLANDGYGLAARLDAQLRAAGVKVREVRVRAPSLASLFARVAAPETEPLETTP